MAHSFNKKRVVLKRSTHQINDPFVIKQKRSTTSKSVTFTDVDEVRYFYKSQAPMQIFQEIPYRKYTAEDYQLVQPNWPDRSNHFYNDTKVRMESVQLVEGDHESQFILEGRCRSLNMSYEKKVHVRYTTDLWTSYHEVEAQFNESIQSNNWDRFYFNIPIHVTLDSKTIYMALRYTADGQDYWDNNDSQNYQVIVKPNESLLTPPKEDTKVLTHRYDFTTSLSAARKPWSPPPSPPGSPLDDDKLQYIPPVFFSSGLTSPPTPIDEQRPPLDLAASAELTKTLNELSLKETQNGVDKSQMTYTDFVNKYCFYTPSNF